MRIELNKSQRTVLFLAAIIIIFVQLAQFDDMGLRGYGWVFSFLISGILIVIGLANKTRPEPPIKPIMSANVQQKPINLPNKEELEAKHSVLRENAEILAIEVEQRANMLATTLIKEKKQKEKGLVYTIRDSKELGEKFSEQLDMHIRERCIYLMLGLVGMRKSKGNKMYITGLEFKTLQDKVFNIIARIAIASHRLMPMSEEINTQALSKSILNDIQQVRKTITQYCVAFESKRSEPESALIEWFESQCGLTLKGNQQIAQALSQESA